MSGWLCPGLWGNWRRKLVIVLSESRSQDMPRTCWRLKAHLRLVTMNPERSRLLAGGLLHEAHLLRCRWVHPRLASGAARRRETWEFGGLLRCYCNNGSWDLS